MYLMTISAEKHLIFCAAQIYVYVLKLRKCRAYSYNYTHNVCKFEFLNIDHRLCF